MELGFRGPLSLEGPHIQTRPEHIRTLRSLAGLADLLVVQILPIGLSTRTKEIAAYDICTMRRDLHGEDRFTL